MHEEYKPAGFYNFFARHRPDNPDMPGNPDIPDSKVSG